MTHYPMWIANQPCYDGELVVADKWLQQPVATVAQGDDRHVEAALSQAEMARLELGKWTSLQRATALNRVVKWLELNQDELIRLLMIETGKPRQDAQVEVNRAILTTRLSAAATSQHGRWWDTGELGEGGQRWGLSKRIPIGVCLLIVPFNFPLNLAMHKIGPALAVGNPVVLKPASLTPLTASKLGECLAECGYPAGTFSMIPTGRAVMDRWLGDPRIRLISFTGSDSVGWGIKSKSTRSEVVLELGGNATCVVDDTVDGVAWVPRLARGAFGLAGQSCISIQSIYTHVSQYDRVKQALCEEAARWVAQSPDADGCRFTCMISTEARERVSALLESGVQAGARRLVGGEGVANRLSACVIEACPLNHPLATTELFAPVVLLHAYTDIQDVVGVINGSRYGLQAGIITQSIERGMMVSEALDVGGVVVGDIPTLRLESLPYGGQKASGMGREGVESAIHHMTTEKSVIVSGLGSVG